ncbi:MAG: sigma-70 family RNA polymerase sigma factor [Planctomycetes bacterium]|nr:sigma-70 family RNA polymerase sigma factor [Planctomycetota bacterium]
MDDEKPTPNQYELEIDQWESLVWYVVNRLKPRLPNSVSEEELHAAGMVGLLKAARSYDPSRGAGFKTYAYHRIRGAMLDELRSLDFLPRSLREKAREKGEQAPAVIGLPTNEDGSDNLEGVEGDGMISGAIENQELAEALQEAIRALPEKMRVVMHLYYNEGRRMHEIGEQLSLTESRVSQIHSAAVARLRRDLRPIGGTED